MKRQWAGIALTLRHWLGIAPISTTELEPPEPPSNTTVAVRIVRIFSQARGLQFHSIIRDLRYSSQPRLLSYRSL